MLQRGKSCSGCVLVEFESLSLLICAMKYYHFHMGVGQERGTLRQCLSPSPSHSLVTPFSIMTLLAGSVGVLILPW